MDPLISVVIPTINRPDLVCRAVRSALLQTFEAIEVIVIVDGPDQATVEALHTLDDSRIRVKMLPCNRGLAEARNEGVEAARGRWIAFLDDDDEWLPGKLDIQLHTAKQSAFQDPIISCRLIKRGEATDVLLPRRLPWPDEPMSEYLFRRTRLIGGEGLVQASTIFTTRELLKKVRFRSTSGRHEDLDWILRASMTDGVSTHFVSTLEPLVVWHKEEQRRTMSDIKDWRFSFSWIQENRDLATSRAYASFLLTWVSANAIAQGDRSAFSTLVKEAYQNGTPSILDGIVFVGIWLIPQGFRRWLVRCLSTAEGSASARCL